MNLRLGYACISKTIDVTTSTNYTYTEFSKNKDYEKLNKIIISNLEALKELIIYNIKNNIHFFRLSSKIIPLATIVDFDYIKPYKKYYEEIGTLINKFNLRVDFHLDQFCVLNSTRKEVIDNTIASLEYHYKLLEALNIKKKLLLLHVGSSTFGKENSIKRFINNFNKLPNYLKNCIAIENDDKVFSVLDCLNISKEIGIPVVIDIHHNNCNPSLFDINDVFKTWKNEIPKIHFSTPKNKTKKDFRSHHDYINSNDFISFIENIKDKNIDIDIMIEAKAKDEALFKLIRELKYKTNYKFIDDTSFIV
jgi:UV DNA damage endonuclease